MKLVHRINNGNATRLAKVVSLFPALWLVGVFLFFIRARAHLGFWPDAHVPDPKSLPFEFHHWVFMIAVFPLAMSIPGMLVFWLYRTWKFKKVVANEIAIYLAGWMAIASVMAIPGVDFVTWFLD